MDDLNRALVGICACKSSFQVSHRIRIRLDNIQTFRKRCEQSGITSMTRCEIESGFKIEVLDEWPNQSGPLQFHETFRGVLVRGVRAAECLDSSLAAFMNLV